jgi:hypothetical protein
MGNPQPKPQFRNDVLNQDDFCSYHLRPVFVRIRQPVVLVDHSFSRQTRFFVNLDTILVFTWLVTAQLRAHPATTISIKQLLMKFSKDSNF